METFIYLRNYQILPVPRQSRGVSSGTKTLQILGKYFLGLLCRLGLQQILFEGGDSFLRQLSVCFRDSLVSGDCLVVSQNLAGFTFADRVN